jgi:hypothetical protein
MSIICYCIFKANLGLDGVYYGAIAAVTFNTVLNLLIAYTTDWEVYM